MIFVCLAVVAALLGVALFWVGLRLRNVDTWLWNYLRHPMRDTAKPGPGPTHVMFCFVDHYEPLLEGANFETGRGRVQKWLDHYPAIAGKFRDADGHPPKHSYFFPAEEYHVEYLDMIKQLCEQKRGEIEIHLHHDNDTADNFVKSMSEFIKLLRERHGVLPEWRGKPAFSFIHGNWALDNCRPDGKWCGINNEITLLRDLNCYADFTFPSAPSRTQSSTINQIYYAVDDPQKPNSHDCGTRVTAGGKETGDLLMIQGPLALNWKSRKLGIWPRVENGDFCVTGVPLAERLDLWVRQAVHVPGREDWLFVKIHTHGCDPDISNFMFDQGAFEELCSLLEQRFNDGERFKLHYVSARECFNVVKAAQAGKSGDPGQYRDFEIAAPEYCR